MTGKNVMPNISIVMPVYNETGNLKATLESVFRQRYKDYELLLVDDGSTDDTCEEIIRIANGDSRVRILRKSNGGIAKALNYGIEHSHGQYIARIDAGDIALPDWLGSQLSLLSTKNTDLAFARIFLVDTELKPFYVSPLLYTKNVNQKVLNGKAFPHPFLLARKSLFINHGLYPENDGIEDHVLWNTYAEQGVMIKMSKVICGMAVREPEHNEILEKRLQKKAHYHKLNDDKLEKTLLKAGIERYIIYPKHYRSNIKIPIRNLAVKYKMNFIFSVIKAMLIKYYVKALIHVKNIC